RPRDERGRVEPRGTGVLSPVSPRRRGRGGAEPAARRGLSLHRAVRAVMDVPQPSRDRLRLRVPASGPRPARRSEPAHRQPPGCVRGRQRRSDCRGGAGRQARRRGVGGGGGRRRRGGGGGCPLSGVWAGGRAAGGTKSAGGRGGSPFADTALRPPTSWVARWVFWLRRWDWAGMVSMGTDASHERLRGARMPESIAVVNVVAVPVSGSVGPT